MRAFRCPLFLWVVVVSANPEPSINPQVIKQTDIALYLNYIFEIHIYYKVSLPDEPGLKTNHCYFW